MIENMRAQLPMAPAGFEWAFFKNAAFIRPKGWNVITKDVSPINGAIGADVYATSPEKFSRENPFEMGFTVQVMLGMSSTVWISAKHAYASYIACFMREIKDEDILILDERKRMQMDSVILRYRDASYGLPPIIVHKFMLINDDLEAFHAYTFESPERSWQENWMRYGTPILSNIAMLHARP